VLKSRSVVERWAPFAAFAVLLATCVSAIGDYPASDPIWYALIADRLAHTPDALQGVTAHPFEMRIGLTGPVAVLYRVFGASPLVTTLPDIIAALAVLMVAVAAQRTWRGRWIAIAFVLSSRALLQDASVLGADLPCGALVAVSVLCIQRRSSLRGTWWLVAGGAAWFLAFLVKETAVWALPVWLYALIVDLRSRGRREIRKYIPAAGALMLLVVAYLLLCSVVWGSPWARFTGIQGLHHAWSMEHATSDRWIQRMTWGPPLFFVNALGLVVLPAVVGWWVRGPERIWLVACAVMVGLFWFGSASASTYSPLPLTPRMIGVVTPVVLVAAAIAVDDLCERLERKNTVRLVGLIVFVGLVVMQGGIGVARYIARPRPESTAIEMVLKSARSRPTLVVCGDPRCPSLVSFYAGFSPLPTLQIEFASEFARRPQPAGVAVLALVNLRRSPRADWYDPATDPVGYRVDKITGLGLPIVLDGDRVRLYDAGDGTRLWVALQPDAAQLR
jgi:hypothetical protein